MLFNPPPGWPQPPAGWTPPPGWNPDPSWPAPPEGWQLWISDTTAAVPSDSTSGTVHADASVGTAPTAPSTVAAAELEAATAAPSTPAQPASPSSAPTTPVQAATTTTAAPDSVALLARIQQLESALAVAASNPSGLVELSDQQVLQDVGIYRYHHPLENAAAYKERLVALEGEMDTIIKSGRAVLAADLFTWDGSLARGRKMVADLSKLMLRAYNAEADNCVRSLRSGNVTTAKKRLEAAVASIEKLGAMMQMRVNSDYHALRVQELELTADFQMKIQEERERAREEREQLREQRRAEQELAAEKERLDKEKAHYMAALAALRAKGDDAAADELAARLSDIEKAIEANDYRIANIRAGYVYVISNIGAFGPNVVKIGMTRRLEPLERVHELGDASVPFRYDVHVLHFSDDAITLENELHAAFADRRVNFVNERREFFFATPAEVRGILDQKAGGILEFNEAPVANEYFQSRGRWPDVAQRLTPEAGTELPTAQLSQQRVGDPAHPT